jgi:hypothetical protein
MHIMLRLLPLNNVEYNINFTTKVSPCIITCVNTIIYTGTMVLMCRRKGWMVIQEPFVMSQKSHVPEENLKEEIGSIQVFFIIS